MAGGRQVAVGLAAVGMCVWTGCFEAPPEAQVRLEQLRADGLALNEAIDEVGGRLLGGRSVVSLWEEMGWRHRSVSEIACQTASTHLAAMERHQEKQDQRSRKHRRQRMQAQAEAVTAATPKQAKPAESLSN